MPRIAKPWAWKAIASDVASAALGCRLSDAGASVAVSSDVMASASSADFNKVDTASVDVASVSRRRAS